MNKLERLKRLLLQNSNDNLQENKISKQENFLASLPNSIEDLKSLKNQLSKTSSTEKLDINNTTQVLSSLNLINNYLARQSIDLTFATVTYKAEPLADIAKLKTLIKSSDEIFDVLDVPELVKMLTINGFYEDAIDLISCRFPVNLSVDFLLTELKRKLSTSKLNLSNSLKFANLLKRLISSEEILEKIFLECRFNFYLFEIKSLKDLKQFIEVSRLCFIDLVTQYQIIFSAGNSLLAVHFIKVYEEFLKNLQQKLKQVNDASQLSQLLNLCMHFGVGLGRKGFDIRLVSTLSGLSIESVFSQRILEVFREMVDEAVLIFTKEYSPVAISSKDDLLQFPLLGHVTNLFLQGFNFIRLLGMVAFAKEGFWVVVECVEKILKVTAYYSKSPNKVRRGSTSKENEDLNLKENLKLIQNIWAPYMLNCYASIFTGTSNTNSYNENSSVSSPGNFAVERSSLTNADSVAKLFWDKSKLRGKARTYKFLVDELMETNFRYEIQ